MTQREEVSEKEKVYGNFVVIANAGLMLTYSLLKTDAKKGMLFYLPLKSGKQSNKVVGLFLSYCEKPSFKCVDALEPLPFPISFSDSHLNLFHWISDYYLCPFERALNLLAPGFIWNPSHHRALEKRISLFEKEKHTKIKGEIELKKVTEINLNAEQTKAYESILKYSHLPSLLYGVTGSGKTEVYLKLAQKIIAEGKTVLILVPEIALTPQMSARFRAVFNDNLCVLHSGLSQMEYIREWLKINFNKTKIVLGVRTAIFCPLKNIGLIIVDEEHDSSYKSSETPCTNSRDVAVYRAKSENAICVLGSATPSLESYYNVKIEKYHYTEMKEKYSLNKISSFVVDAKEEFNLNKGYQNKKFLKASFVDFDETGLCPSILSALKKNKEQNFQSILLINRRGYVNYALCTSCFTTLTCPNCSISTTLHQKGLKEICHYCGFNVSTRKTCGQCGGHSFLLKGLGTQNIEEKLSQFIPELRVSRLDRDVLTSNSRLSAIINDFRQGEIDCLVGTQLLAKGHDFPRVTLVVLLHVEDSLFIPDFRSAERTFQLITQAMGRAGRGEAQGQVILQSFIMNHPVVQFALNGDIFGFYEREIEMRKLAWVPPFCRQILFEVQHKSLEAAQNKMALCRDILVEHWKQKNFSNTDIRLAGPYQATIEKINSIYRVQMCLSLARKLHPKTVVPLERLQHKEFIRFLKIDVDPFSFL